MWNVYDKTGLLVYSFISESNARKWAALYRGFFVAYRAVQTH